MNKLEKRDSADNYPCGDCCCNHNQEHHHEHHPDHKPFPESNSVSNTATQLTCLVENLGCANCATKMESRINDLPEVNAATLTFATKQLRVSITSEASLNEDALITQIQDICSSIESGVIVTKQQISQRGKKSLQAPVNLEKKRRFSNQQTELFLIIGGALLFIIGAILDAIVGNIITSLIYIVSYIILGGQILHTAFKNLMKGQIFDENFLMSVATLGAFAIGDYPEAVGVMLFYRIGEYFEEVAVKRSRSQIMDAVDLRPEVVNLITGNNIEMIPAEDAKLDNILLVRPGDRIPLDGRVIEGESRLDTSPITGEPVPIKVVTGDSVTSGCINTSGQLKIKVEKTLEDSMVTRILDSVENAAASKPQIDRFITRFAKVYTPVVLLVALVTAIIPSLITGNWNQWIYTALTFLVISCPCALVLSVPLTFFSGIGAGSKKGILFKGGVSIEALNNISTVVMDKTGTITQGNFVLQKVVPFQHFTEEEILQLSASCEQNSSHPIAASITTAAQERSISLERPASLKEIAGHGMKANISGKDVLVGNRKLMQKFNVDLSDAENTSYGTEVFIAINSVLAGYLIISDTIKPEAKSAIASLKRMGIIPAMLTGDTQESAQAVAHETGIEKVYAKLLPEDKLNKLQLLRKRNGSVMFVGDGINDAPVLAGADVGAAMGSGADAAIEAADVVFMTSNMEAVPQSISIAKKTSRIVWQNVIFALLVKFLVMLLGLTGHASMWLAVFADSGVTMLCVLNSIRILYQK